MGEAPRRTRRRRQAPVTPAPPIGRAGFALAAALTLAALVVVSVLYVNSGRDDSPEPALGGAPAAGSGPLSTQVGPPPWIAEQEHLPARLDKIGIPFSNMEGTAFHIHPKLSVYAEGEPVEVPTDIGISYAERAMAALHTHDADGTVHVESPVVRDYTLGQFFDTWGVRLTKTCVGGYCAGGGKQLEAFVDGKPAPDPRRVKLVDEQRIVVAYGTAAEIEQAVG